MHVSYCSQSVLTHLPLSPTSQMDAIQNKPIPVLRRICTYALIAVSIGDVLLDYILIVGYQIVNSDICCGYAIYFTQIIVEIYTYCLIRISDCKYKQGYSLSRTYFARNPKVMDICL